MPMPIVLSLGGFSFVGKDGFPSGPAFHNRAPGKALGTATVVRSTLESSPPLHSQLPAFPKVIAVAAGPSTAQPRCKTA